MIPMNQWFPKLPLLSDEVGAKVGAAVGAAVGAPVGAAVGAAVGAPVGARSTTATPSDLEAAMYA